MTSHIPNVLAALIARPINTKFFFTILTIPRCSFVDVQCTPLLEYRANPAVAGLALRRDIGFSIMCLNQHMLLLLLLLSQGVGASIRRFHDKIRSKNRSLIAEAFLPVQSSLYVWTSLYGKHSI